MRSLVLLFLIAHSALAEEDAIAVARQHFVAGAELVRAAQWAEALLAFEKSHALRPHAVTLYNIGACERALGHYTRARAELQSALQPTLPESLATESKAFIGEIDRLLAHIQVTLAPPDAALAVDGRPLEMSPEDPHTLTAGTLAPGPGQPPPAQPIQLVLNPGAHVLTLSRKGFTDVVLNRTFSPGGRDQLSLELERLPAHLRIESTLPNAVVRLDGVDIGVAPIEVMRPAGGHLLVVEKPGYLPYRAQLAVQPGEEANLRVTLEVAKRSLLRRWWFWTAAGAVLASASIGTYLIVRSTEVPPLDGGGLQWVAKVQ